MCEHANFQAHVKVNRIQDGELGPVVAHEADIKIQCADCKEFFEFIGVPAGLSPIQPMASIDFTEIRCPIIPSTQVKKSPIHYKSNMTIVN
jgi:hypothetical protein